MRGADLVTGTTMQVPLAPDYRRWHPSDDAVSLTSGPLLARGRDGYRQHAPRWHRPRSARRYPKHTSWQFWCGQTGSKDLLLADDLPAGEKVCGACEGRAMGAGWPPVTLPAGNYPLTFTPPKLQPPIVCPGSYSQPAYDRRGQWWLDMPGGRAGQCLFCGSVQPIRGGYRGYQYTQPGPAKHEPVSLIEPCRDHGWLSMVRFEDRLYCRCEMEAV